MNREPFVTVIIPCRNEEQYIRKVLDNMLYQDYPDNQYEVLVLDGMSDDRTPEIVKEYAAQYPIIKYLENPERVVPFALNKGIRESSGEVVVRVDAHSDYPKDYLSQLVFYLYKLNADNVGGSWNTLPADSRLQSGLIAAATSNSFGIGDAQYRLANKEIKEVDTVPYGCYKREVFDKIGLFDEELVRNQDDELNARLKEHGGKIYLIPFVKINYYARDRLNKMMKMFYQYGYFKPLVNRKIKKPATIRQFVPLFFVIYLVFLIFLLAIDLSLVKYYLIPLGLYLLLSFSISFSLFLKKKKLEFFFLMPLVFFMIHISYGWGYLSGIFQFVLLRQKKIKTFNINR